MASVVSSSFVIDAHAQKDGSHYVKEFCTLIDGRILTSIYKLPAGQGDTQAQAKLDARVASFNADFPDAEADTIIRAGVAPAPVHQTKAEFAARFWARLQIAFNEDKFRFAAMVWWLYTQVQAGVFTSNEVRLTFNTAYNRSLSVAQWNSLVSGTIKTIRDRHQAVLDQVDL